MVSLLRDDRLFNIRVRFGQNDAKGRPRDPSSNVVSHHLEIPRRIHRTRSHLQLRAFFKTFDPTELVDSDIVSSGKVKAGQLWGKNKEDLTKQLAELKTELGQLRIQKVASSGSKLNKIHDLRKSIARVLTVINASQRSQLRLFYKNKKYAPLDLRPKQTRAIRRRLSPEDKARVLEKTKKRNVHFPQRRYAIKAEA
ncbi:ribosomal l29 protein [Sarocladium implicatum]|nr:ribosomal l29 protein [Sarocladium implicatum]